MLSRKIPKLRLYSKSKGEYSTSNDSSNRKRSTTSLSMKQSNLTSITNMILLGIPVLSIFAFLGILLISTNTIDTAYADEITPHLDCGSTADAALSINGLPDSTASEAGFGITSYRTYQVSTQTCNANDYNLTIAGPSTMGNDTIITSVDGALSDNEWGYYYGSDDEENISSYKKLNGSSNPERLEYNTGDINSTKNLTFGVKFGENATLGHYSATINLALTITPKASVYTLSFDANGGAGAPHQQSCTTELGGTSCDITLDTLRPTRAGYSFQGWATSSSATTANIQPGATVTLSNSVTYYAVWKAVTGFGGITQMQQMSANICNSVSIGTTGQLYDTRDNNDYTVAKLADGNCWMTQNLRVSDRQVDLISNTDGSDTGVNYTIPAIGSWSGTTGAIEGVYYDNNPDNGAYYTWYTLTGKTGSSSVTNGDASSSICPAGWTLPKGGPDGQYQALYDKYNSNQMSDSGRVLLGASSISAGGAYFPAAGLITNGTTIASLGAEGSYWTRTADSSTNIYYLYFSKNTLSADFTYRNRDWAFPARCVAAPTATAPVVKDLSSISTMQEMTSSICSNTSIGASKTLTDTRDSNSYSVRKLADGKCWMTSNLRITGRSVNLVNNSGQETGTTYSIPSSRIWTGTTSTTEGAYYPGNSTNGAYYTWYTAVGKSTTGATSICPKGWVLPTASYSSNFYNLYIKYNSNQVSSYQRILLGASTESAGGAYFPATGYVLNGSLNGVGTDGNYWSRTTSGDYIWRLGFNSSSIDYASYAGAASYYGFPIRCVSA